MTNAAGTLENQGVTPMAYPEASEGAAAAGKEESAAQATVRSLNQRTLVLAEKLLSRLPAEGAVVVIGSASRTPEPSPLARQLAGAMQTISSKPTLLIRLAHGGKSDSRDQSRGPGLVEILRGTATLQQALEAGESSGVRILGHSDAEGPSSELVASHAFRELLNAAAKTFPWIVIECGSLVDQAEGSSVISRADGVVCSVKRGEGRRSDVESLQSLCAEFNTCFLGVVLV